MVLATAACQPGRLSDNDKGPFKVKIADYSPELGYHLKVQEITTLESIHTAQGAAANFMVQPRFVSGHVNGRPMKLQVVKSSDGVYIAQNADTLQALTLYSHFERLKQLDEKLGVAKLNPGPRKVIVQALFQKANAGDDIDNAFYSANLDAILFSKFTSSALPLMANGGVVAHEHFHSIFQKTMSEGTPLPLSLKAAYLNYSPHDQASTDLETTEPEDEIDLTGRQQYDVVLLRAFNEGLADVWGWAYSGDPDFVGRSVPKFKGERSLNKDLIEFTSGDLIRGEMERLNKANYNFISYRIGTEIARFAREALEHSLGKEATAEQKMKVVLEFLPKLKNFVQGLKADQYWEPSEAMTLFVKNLNPSQASTCAVLSEKYSDETRRIFFNLCRKEDK